MEMIDSCVENNLTSAPTKRGSSKWGITSAIKREKLEKMSTTGNVIHSNGAGECHMDGISGTQNVVSVKLSSLPFVSDGNSIASENDKSVEPPIAFRCSSTRQFYRAVQLHFEVFAAGVSLCLINI